MNRIILTKGIVYDWSTLGDMEIDNKDNLHTSESMLQDALFNLKGKKVKLILEVGNDEYEEISELKHVASLLLSTQQDCVRLQKQLSSIKTLDRGEVEKILNQFKSIPCSSLNWLTDNDGKKVGYIPLKGSYIVSELTDKNIEFITNAICKLEVKEEQYKHVGYIKMHFADYGSDADDVRPVLALQTLRDILNYKDGNYKIYLEEQWNIL